MGKWACCVIGAWPFVQLGLKGLQPRFPELGGGGGGYSTGRRERGTRPGRVRVRLAACPGAWFVCGTMQHRLQIKKAVGWGGRETKGLNDWE